ncbi:MAG TPA: type 2 lanthipeptide synthetase LanM family protein [Xanthomonadaceae bacterium]
MASETDAGNFDVCLGCLLSPALGELATQLDRVAGIQGREREVILAATRETLYSVLRAKLSRLLVLELNAARVTGRLQGEDSGQRWTQFLEIASGRGFWDEMDGHYPSLLSRVDRIVGNRCAASLSVAQRWAANRSELACLLEGDAGELLELSFGAGDSHCAGLTVAVIRCESGRIVYKPRSMRIDNALYAFLAKLGKDHGSVLPIGVPRVLDYGDYGWAEFIPHRHASGPEELRSFYRGIGHWLAIMRLLGGSDLHAENLIAHGGSPVVVDCETLFTPRFVSPPSGFGKAVDRASELISGTVLNIGLLPMRGLGLGWRGVDISAVGMLPGQQPMHAQPGIVRAGSDEAHIGSVMVEAHVSQNHPSPQPALADHWPEVLSGFDELTDLLRRLDASGALAARLEPFLDCRVRIVVRATEVYAELGRMLWHPISLHKLEPARERAFGLLAKMAANVSSAPSDPVVIHAEIDDLLIDDIPFFSTLAGIGRLDGPGGTHWLPPRDLVATALQDWRAADIDLERKFIHVSVVSAYVNDGWLPEEKSMWAECVRAGDLDTRRRRQAAQIVRNLVAHAIRGDDGSVAWIAPIFVPPSWSIQPVPVDMYNGMSGIALLAGAYLRETAAGRADPVEGLEEVFEATLRTLERERVKNAAVRNDGVKLRPSVPGGYIGLGSQIWTQLVLAHWGYDADAALDRARALAKSLPESVAADDMYDLLAGMAGAIVPLLLLARKTGEEGYLELASDIGDRLCDLARRQDDRAYWSDMRWPDGVGGYAHGVTGIGWALARLARETRNPRHQETAEAAFAFEDSLFDEEEQNWLDLRLMQSAKTAAAWCHGAVGIGLAHADLDPRFEHPRTRQTLRRAAAATWRMGMGWNHCACHGDLGGLELMERALEAGEAPEGLTHAHVLESILTSLEDHGASCGMVRDAFVPGLLPGVGGVAYQLLRAHPASGLPSILAPGGDEL